MNHTPSRSNCFMYAFDCVHELGGYLAIGMTARTGWDWQHLGHYDNLSGEFSSFVPPGDLEQHWHAVLGFDGAVEHGDVEYRRPMTKREMSRGITALYFAFWSWRIKRWFDNFWRPIP